MSLKLKIISDGTDAGTKVVETITGEELVGVEHIHINYQKGDVPLCILTLYGVEVSMLAELPEECNAARR